MNQIQIIFQEAEKNYNDLFICSGSGAVALAHMDVLGIDEAVCNMVQRVQELAMGYPEGRIELQLIGGYSNPRPYTKQIFFNIMSKYQYYFMNIILKCRN